MTRLANSPGPGERFASQCIERNPTSCCEHGGFVARAGARGFLALVHESSSHAQLRRDRGRERCDLGVTGYRGPMTASNVDLRPRSRRSCACDDDSWNKAKKPRAPARATSRHVRSTMSDCARCTGSRNVAGRRNSRALSSGRPQHRGQPSRPTAVHRFARVERPGELRISRGAYGRAAWLSSGLLARWPYQPCISRGLIRARKVGHAGRGAQIMEMAFY